MNFALDQRNCGEPVGLEEKKKIMMDMLETFADCCEANRIRYWLDGGTLIGAARHQGFILWNDDIDVTIPRTDAKKPKEITGGKTGAYELVDPDDRENTFSEHWCLYNDRYVAKSLVSGVYRPLWIDVLPMVGFPDEQKEIERLFFKLRIWRSLQQSSAGSL